MTFRKRTILVASALALGGCDLAPHYEKPATDSSGTFKEAVHGGSPDSEGWRIATPHDSIPRGKWWEAYGDPELDALEQRVAISNQTVAQAEASYRAARALLNEARANILPMVGLDPSVIRSRSSSSGGSQANSSSGAAGAGSTPGSGSSSNSSGNGQNPKTTFTLPVEASYEIDLWGSVRNTVAEQRYSAQASAAQVEGALLSTQSALAQDYFSLRAADEQRRILGTTLADYEASYHLVNTLFKNGLASEEDVAEADTQLDGAEAQLTDLGVARAQYEHAIAVLIGVPPAKFSIGFSRFSADLPAVPVGLPSDLLERRPDIAAAERQVAAANAAIGVARAAYFPELTISGYAGFESNRLAQLFDWPNRIWSIGPSVLQPLFDGGLRMAQNEQARAQYDATVAGYRQTVLSAFQATEDNLVTLRVLSKEVVQLHKAAQAAERSVKLSVTRYQNGIDSYVNVITAQNTFLSNRLAELQIQLRQLIATVSLVTNLGGGWETSQWSQTEKTALHPPGKGEPPQVPAANAQSTPNPPPLPDTVKRPEDLLKQNEEDMAPEPKR